MDRETRTYYNSDLGEAYKRVRLRNEIPNETNVNTSNKWVPVGSQASRVFKFKLNLYSGGT